ncbi:MAG TPA: hypothetical protein VMW50_14920 [Dehalococcoidia bacterium]|nr:hypothetical protein [Dehalococcoidia bacterium]
MADRIVIAGVIILIGLALLSPINDVLYNTLLPMINNTTDVTQFEVSTWRLMPIILIVFVGVAVIVALVVKHNEDENKPQ